MLDGSMELVGVVATGSSSLAEDDVSERPWQQSQNSIGHNLSLLILELAELSME
jgi:hypothetical protein